MRRIIAASLALAIAGTAARAQTPNPNCASASTSTADACEKATDLFNYMMPQLGTSLVGGSHTLGIGTTLGGFPHFAIALRANVIRGNLPDVSAMQVGYLARVSNEVATTNQFLGLPAVDFALGLYKGFPLGVTRVGGVDLIGSVTYVPNIDKAENQIALTTDDGSTKIGIGARIGILEQSLVVPGVSFSYLVRDVPTMTLEAAAQGADFTISNFSVKTKSWRLAAQKNLAILQLGVGIGQDTYNSTADLVAVVNRPTPAAATLSTSLAQDVTRTTMYGSLGLNILLAKLVVEVGQVSGGSISSYNRFADPADASRLYGTLGLRISF